MPTISTSPYWSAINIDHLCQNWTVDIDGIDRRQGNHAKAGTIIGSTVNHLLGRHPRILFWGAIPVDDVWSDLNARDPLFRWKYDDSVKTARTWTVRALTVPRVTANAEFANAYLTREGDSTSNTAYFNLNVATTNWFYDVAIQEMQVTRGAETNALVEEGLSAFGGYRVLDVVVYEDELYDLDSDIHWYVDTGAARTREKVLADLPEQVRARLHDLRTKTLPQLISWCAQGGPSGWGTPNSPGDATGMVVNSDLDGNATWVNLLDHDYAARTANTPGVSCPVYRCGRGAETTPAGNAVKMTLYVIAAATAGATGASVRLESYISNATLNVSNTAADWLTFPTMLELNSAVVDTSRDAERNKVDILGKVTNGALYVWAIQGPMTYV